MNSDDLIHAAPVVVKSAAALSAAIPFTAIVKRMLGPAADEVAKMWRDQVRVYGYQRQLKLLEKAEKMAHDAGFTPQAVPPKILFPLLEGASFEDNEDLHDMWAAGLANAASPHDAGKIQPRSLLAILRQMASDEAKLLNKLYSGELIWEMDQQDAMDLYARLGFGPADSTSNQLAESLSFVRRFAECRDCLEAAQLIGLIDLTGTRLLVSTSLEPHSYKPAVHRIANHIRCPTPSLPSRTSSNRHRCDHRGAVVDGGRGAVDGVIGEG